MRYLALFLLIIVTPILACPDLEGRFAKCRSMTGRSLNSTDLVISQSTVDGVDTYMIEQLFEDSTTPVKVKLVANGETYSQTDDHGFDFTSRTVCAEASITRFQTQSLEGHTFSKKVTKYSMDYNGLTIDTSVQNGRMAPVFDRIYCR